RAHQLAVLRSALSICTNVSVCSSPRMLLGLTPFMAWVALYDRCAPPISRLRQLVCTAVAFGLQTANHPFTCAPKFRVQLLRTSLGVLNRVTERGKKRTVDANALICLTNQHETAAVVGLNKKGKRIIGFQLGT